MTFSSVLTPVEVLTYVLAPNAVVDWHAHLHDEFCLIVDGTLSVGHAGAKILPDPGTLFLFREGEMHALWNRGSATSHLWRLDFRITSEARTEFSALFDRPPEKRTIRLSPGQQKLFCVLCQKIAFEKSAADASNHPAASAWLVIQLVSVTRWLAGRTGQSPIEPEVEIESAIELKGNLDPQCFDLWQKIHQHALLPTSAEPMLFGQDPGHDSLRHRFRKAFGVSPQGMLVRLRMNRAKGLLRTGNFSVKEIASQLGYARQHEFARAFHKFIGMSPSEWKMQTDAEDLGICERGRLSGSRSPVA
jgi:hypothetical protein